MKLLLVDDDVFLRDMYAVKFGESDYIVSVAASAEQAITVLEKEQDFDAILVDIVMPGMNGFELIQEIKELFPDITSAIIVLSNQGQETDVGEAKKAGAAGYIIKAEAIPSDVVKQVTDIINKR